MGKCEKLKLKISNLEYVIELKNKSLKDLKFLYDQLLRKYINPPPKQD